MMEFPLIKICKLKFTNRIGKYWACFFICVLPILYYGAQVENNKNEGLYISPDAALFISEGTQIFLVRENVISEVSQNLKTQKPVVSEKHRSIKENNRYSKSKIRFSCNEPKFCFSTTQNSNDFVSQYVKTASRFYNPNIQNFNALKTSTYNSVKIEIFNQVLNVKYKSVMLLYQYFTFIQSRPPPFLHLNRFV